MPGEAAFQEYLTVRAAAERLALSEETVRRMIRRGELQAERRGRGSRAPLMVDARQVAADADRAAARRRLAGVVVGRGEQFVERMGGEYGPEGEDWARRRHARTEVLNALADAVAAELQQFEDVAAEREHIEEQAQALAARVRRAELIRERAAEILDEDVQDRE